MSVVLSIKRVETIALRSNQPQETFTCYKIGDEHISSAQFFKILGAAFGESRYRVELTSKSDSSGPRRQGTKAYVNAVTQHMFTITLAKKP